MLHTASGIAVRWRRSRAFTQSKYIVLIHELGKSQASIRIKLTNGTKLKHNYLLARFAYLEDDDARFACWWY